MHQHEIFDIAEALRPPVWQTCVRMNNVAIYSNQTSPFWKTHDYMKYTMETKLNIYNN